MSTADGSLIVTNAARARALATQAVCSSPSNASFTEQSSNWLDPSNASIVAPPERAAQSRSSRVESSVVPVTVTSWNVCTSNPGADTITES